MLPVPSHRSAASTCDLLLPAMRAISAAESSKIFQGHPILTYILSLTRREKYNTQNLDTRQDVFVPGHE